MKSRWTALLGIPLFLLGCRAENTGSPSGGMVESKNNFQQARTMMIEQQLKGPGRNITNEQVIAVMNRVPRHEFVPPHLRSEAYGDYPLPIGHGQTISQPYIVAFMTQALDPDPEDRVLEIGTGSGYQAAVLSQMVQEVFTIEIIPELGESAKQALSGEKYSNVHVRIGDGYRGWPEEAPFDSIIVTASPDHIPQPLVEQLKDGGRMIIPVGNLRSGQELYLLEKKEGEMHRTEILPVRFVPMTGEAENR